MPIYEYLCEACKTQIEVMQKYTDPAPTACESCGNGPMVKQLSLSSFALKGTGWYVTDFKGTPKPAPSKDGESSAAPASTPSEAKGDAGSSSSAAKGEASQSASQSASQPASDKASSPSKSTPESSSGGKSETSLK
jgi:putative FmdB family regulatory protein